MTDIHAYSTDPLFERACHYATLLGGIRGWLDATTTDPRFPDLPIVSPERALAEIRRLVDQFDTEQAATPAGGDRR
jgi:hypothetical protein